MVEPDKIDDILSRGEGQRVEFKTSFAEDNEAIETLCAFINADGGTVLFGVTDQGIERGVSVGGNTLENLANKIRRDTQPPISPIIEEIKSDEIIIVAVTVQKAKPGQLYYAFNAPFIRIGKTNQVMSPDEQRTRLLTENVESNRPKFEITSGGTKCIETEFTPSKGIRLAAGDYVTNIEWRYRGPRFHMDWQQTTGYALERTNISGTFDLSSEPKEDELVGINEMAIEIRFLWHDKWRHELHIFLINRRELPNKVHWDVGREIFPPKFWDE
jgi:hypothetical protein